MESTETLTWKKNILTTADQLTPDWLTSRLRTNGFLYSGHVTEVKQAKSFRTPSSHMWHLTVTYSDDSPQSAPRKLFLKLSNPGRSSVNGREVEFYTHVAPAMLNPPVLCCYDASFDGDANAYHLLLEDRSETHCVPEFPLPPTEPHAEMIVDGLARFHAFWWDHERLGQDVGEFPSEHDLGKVLSVLRTPFLSSPDYLADRLTQEHRSLFEAAFAKHPVLLLTRLQKNSNFTFVHGDAHGWNFLLPRYADGDQVYIIDWYSYVTTKRCWLGASDLARLMVNWWHPERRQHLEEPLLRRYLDRLREHGVGRYSWEDLWYDYRLCAISSLYVAINEVRRSKPTQWLPQLERAITAVREFGALEL